MSSFLVPLTDALVPQSFGTELPDSAPGTPSAFGAGTPFYELFPQLLAELTATPVALPSAVVPDVALNPTQTEFPAGEAGGRLCRPTVLLEQIDPEQPEDDPASLPAWPVQTTAGFLNAPAPLWTVPSFSAFGEISIVGLAETPEEPSPREEENATSSEVAGKSGMTVVPPPALLVPAKDLSAAGWAPVSPTIVDVDIPVRLPEVQVGPLPQPLPPLGQQGSRKENDTESGALETEAFSAPAPPPAPASTQTPIPTLVIAPEGLPARPTEPSLPAARGPQEVSLQPGETRSLEFGKDEPALLRPKADFPASSDERDRPATREAFRLLLRNHTSNASAEQRSPIKQELSAQSSPSTETTPSAFKIPAPLRERTESSEARQTYPEPVRPQIPKALTHAADVKNDTGEKPPDTSPDNLRAAQTQTSGTRHEPPSSLAPDTERKQGDRKSPGRDEDGAVGNAAKPESAVKPVVLPAREFSGVHEERHVALQPDSGAEPPPAASAVDDAAPVVPPSRTVQQLRVTLPPSAEGRNVEVLLNQRPGGVEVSVRSPDPQIRETLRSGLSDLIGAFDRKGVAAETLPITVSGHSTQAGQTHGLTEAGTVKGLSVHAETADSEMREDPQQNQQRQAQWEPDGDNRRRREQPAEAWQKYMEEYAWRSL
ncbi:MAG: hypothetical protein U0R19_31555 [Bryobacteraceae bacterium]